MAPVDPLKNTDWLSSRFKDSDIRVLDGTWFMPGTPDSFAKGVIPGAQFFDIDKVATPHPTLTHMLPNAERFEAAMDAMDIKPSDHVVCYDRRGVSTSPRLWWTFRMFGHQRVSVLNGGLPAWVKASFQIDETYSASSKREGSKYASSSALSGVISMMELVASLGDDLQIVDARPAGRFFGTTPEPRSGLRSGRIPGSINLPFVELVQDGSFLDVLELAEKTGLAGVDLSRPIITTCGSGVTAAGLAFVFHRLGAENVRVYDGSWSEWGASDAPIEV